MADDNVGEERRRPTLCLAPWRAKQRWRAGTEEFVRMETDEERVQVERGEMGGEGVDSQIRKGCAAGL